MKELIKISGYSLNYKDKSILNNVTYSFYSGNVYLIDGKNGVGKSSFIKSLLGLEKKDKHESGSIQIDNSKNVLEMSDSELLELRSKVAYLEQKDYYESYKGISVFEILKDSYKAHIGRKLTVDDLDYIKNVFDEYADCLTFDLNSKVHKLSGGQQRMLSIISSICLMSDSKVYIIDEPLNNLDMNNVVKISNVLNKLVRSKKDSIVIMVTHCKIFPFITKVINIEDCKFVENSNSIECHSCFGNHDEDGFYN